MYRFVSSIKAVDLKSAYLQMYNVKLLQSKLDSLMIQYPDIKKVLPNDISAKNLLVGNFKYLTKVYWAFTSYLNGKSESVKKKIKSKFKDNGFNYESHKSKIANFLIDARNGFEIHNCVYCDLEDVTPFFKKDKKVRRFKTEHVLDKGECPLVAMSLYNFVPSCCTCNDPTIKGTKTIGDSENEISKLSPTAFGYDFEDKVDFVVNVLPGCKDFLNATSHIGDYEIDFNVRDVLYQKTIDLFELKSRYNNDNVKSELLKWRDKRQQYPNNIVQEFADIRKITFDEMFEELFDLDRKKHFPMEKARRNVMLMY